MTPLCAPLRTDSLEVCLGGCGKKLLLRFYFCQECEPEGWDRRAPDPERVAQGVARAKAQVGTGGVIARKPQSKKQEAEARAFYAARGEAYPWDEKEQGA